MDSPAFYNNYGIHPRILDRYGTSSGADFIDRLKDGTVIFRPQDHHRLSLKEIKIPSEHIFDLAPPTFMGLLDDLIPGSELTENFLGEWERFQRMFGQDIVTSSYGVWVYYPRKNHLVRFTPLYWHRLALLVRNSTLLRDQRMAISWQRIREIFEKTIVATAGCSVGNNAIHALVQDLRPFHVKVADHKDYHITNGNRIRLTYEDFGRNKAVVTAEQLHSVDPFLKISVFSEGIHEGNIQDFIVGNSMRQEPSTSILVEETDDPDMKIMLRQEARRQRIPVLMVTDLGSAIQLDIRRFDVVSDLPLAACGISDEELFAKRDKWRNDLANRDKFYKFAFALIGSHYRRLPEFKKIVMKEEELLFGGVPQLGSTAMTAGGIAGEAVARLSLGFKLRERMFINKHTGEVLIEGEKL